MVISIVALWGLLTTALNTGVRRDASGHIEQAAAANVGRLQAGDCILSFDGSHPDEQVRAVPCAQPHQAEVFAVFALDGATTQPARRPRSPYPGQGKVAELAEEGARNGLAGV